METETAKFKIESKPAAAKQTTFVNQRGSLYKKDEAAFHGNDRLETDSQNTHFQQNAAKFIGLDEVPQSGERIVKIEKGKKTDDQGQGKSYLNEQRLKQHVSLTGTLHSLISNIFVLVGIEHAAQPSVREEQEEIPCFELSRYSLRWTKVYS